MAQQQHRKRYVAEERHIDDDSMRRHEIDRGSDIDYNTARSSLKNKREYFIKDGNVEILQLMTRDKTRDAAAMENEDNIYVNVPLKASNLSHPQLLMVDNSGKEILMRRFIEEQPDGKQIIREHYQIVPGATYIQSMPNEVQQHSTLKGDTFPLGKSGPNSIVYSQTEPEVKVIHTQPVQGAVSVQVEGFPGQMQPATSNQSLTQELENSLKTQNALLRQILMEKEKLEVRYTQQEVALETQSLPGQSMAIATQTDCDAGTQTDADAMPYIGPGSNGVTLRRKARSENDDSMSEDEYEYVRFSPPNSPEGVYWIKRKRQKKRSKHRGGSQPRKRIVMVEEVKRKIRTPIKEEDDEFYEYRKRSPPKKPLRYHGETKTSILRRMKNEENKRAAALKRNSEALNREVLMEISDSLDEKASPDEQRRHKIRVEQVEYYEQSGEEYDYDEEGRDSLDSDADEIVIKSNAYTPNKQDSEQQKKNAKLQHRYEIQVRDRSPTRIFSRSSSEQKEEHIATEPKVRLSRKDSHREDGTERQQKRAQTSSEPPQNRISIAKYQTNSDTGTKVTTTTTELRNSKRLIKDRVYASETDLLDRDDVVEPNTRGVPKYMEWYYGKKNKPSVSGRTSTDSSRGHSITKKRVAEKRISKTRINAKQDDALTHEEGKYKPEPAPRKSPPKGSRLLKEDIEMNRQHKPKIETETNHPLVQHSEHRFERENAPDVPIPPTKLPHYMYPETPPFAATKEQAGKKLKPKPSPIKENEIKVTNAKINLFIEDPNATHPPAQKQLNVSTLEDDHDSGIAMNSLLNSMGRRNPIAEKKSVFSIAYDDVSRVKKITSGGESPQYS